MDKVWCVIINELSCHKVFRVEKFLALEENLYASQCSIFSAYIIFPSTYTVF